MSNSNCYYDKDDELVKVLFAGFFSDKTIQDKIDCLAKNHDEKDETGWENWLKFEFKFYLDFIIKKQIDIELEPQITTNSKTRADLAINNNILIELKRKINISTCYREIIKDYKKYVDPVNELINTYDKVYYIGIFHKSNDIEGAQEKYFKELLLRPMLQEPIIIGTKGYQASIFKHQLV